MAESTGMMETAVPAKRIRLDLSGDRPPTSSKDGFQCFADGTNILTGMFYTIYCFY